MHKLQAWGRKKNRPLYLLLIFNPSTHGWYLKLTCFIFHHGISSWISSWDDIWSSPTNACTPSRYMMYGILFDQNIRKFQRMFKKIVWYNPWVLGLNVYRAILSNLDQVRWNMSHPVSRKHYTCMYYESSFTGYI